MSLTTRIAGVLAAITLIAMPTAAFAGTYGGGTATVSNSSPEAGAQVTVSGSGFAANSEVKVYFRSTPQLLATTTSDASGSASATVTIPASATGSHTLELVGVDPAGAALVLSTPITVVSSSLPSTGGSTWPIAIGAVIAGLAGVGLLAIARFRRSASAT